MENLKKFVFESLEAIEHWHNQQVEAFDSAMLTKHEEHDKETLQILKENSSFKARKAREYIKKIMNLQSESEIEIIELIKQFVEEARA